MDTIHTHNKNEINRRGKRLIWGSVWEQQDPQKRSRFKNHRLWSLPTCSLHSVTGIRGSKNCQALPRRVRAIPGPLETCPELWGSHIPPSLSIHSPVKVGVITFYMYSLSLRKIKSLPTSTVPGWQGRTEIQICPSPRSSQLGAPSRHATCPPAHAPGLSQPAPTGLGQERKVGWNQHGEEQGGGGLVPFKPNKVETMGA